MSLEMKVFKEIQDSLNNLCKFSMSYDIQCLG